MASGSSVILRFVLIALGGLALAGCEGTELPGFLSRGGGKPADNLAAGRTVERDVEAPEVFQVSDSGLWDGRPTLGGVWVAHPRVDEPERVIIRNQSNGQFVIGVIYRPERSTPGPKFQVSSDAAEALEMLAGQPAELSVTALKRVEAPAAEAGAQAGPATSADGVDPIQAASRALDAAESTPSVSAASITPPAAPTRSTGPAPAPAPAAAAPTQRSALDKPYLQIGIFSVESNALGTADTLRKAGMVPAVKQGTMSGKAFWRVIVGPSANAAERAALLGKIKALGFADAYAVTN